MSKVIDQHGKVWPTQEAYFAAMEARNPLSAAITQMANDSLTATVLRPSTAGKDET